MIPLGGYFLKVLSYFSSYSSITGGSPNNVVMMVLCNLYSCITLHIYSCTPTFKISVMDVLILIPIIVYIYIYI